ncbi:MAG: PAS domain S-box protein, partial [Candidatus Electrothrix sp. ATG2]|nr:PAS domain S-box protein [Candidatus Electrothrix sp. ATG2]
MKQDDHYLKKELYSLIKKDSSIFDFLQDGSLDGLWYWDLEKPENEWMNPRYWSILGYDPKEKRHLTSEWQELIFPEDLEVALDNFNKHCIDPEHPYDQVVRYRHKNGSTVWVRCRGMAIRDKAGKPIRMLGAHTDLTQLKQTEEALRESEELHRVTIENILDPVFITDDLGKFTFVCPNIAHTLGFSEDEIMALGNISVFFGKELFDREELNRLGHISNIDAVISDKSGKKRNYLVTAKRVSIKGGTTLYVCRDITKNKLAEEELRDREELFKALFEQAGGYCMILDPNTPDGIPVIIDANEAACLMHGYTQEEFIGRPVADINNEDGNHLCKKRTIEIMKGKPFYVEKVHVRKDGTTFPVAVNAKRIDIGGKPPLILTTEYDLTEQKKNKDTLTNIINLAPDIIATANLHDGYFKIINPAFA